ncbi:hypothetical protein QUA00_34045 [Microcoleus sp. T2B6]|uniref:hypothetical protein n=1 Tax=Microcoleus sp. T2B6 TaxID=3055424 RepID=UPI002FD1B01C
MPVPQENLYFVEQASCLLLTMVQDISLNRLKSLNEEIIDFSPLLEDFSYETGVFNPCRTLGVSDKTETAFTNAQFPIPNAQFPIPNSQLI